MSDYLYRIPSHLQYRNIGANALTGLELARNTVIFGINGVGKTTISALLEEHISPESINQPNCSRPVKNFAIFNRDWMESSVGELIRGRSADGIATIVLGEHNIEAHKRLSNAQGNLAAKEKEISELRDESQKAKRRIDDLVKRIQNAIKTDSSNAAVGLSSTTFRAPAV